MLIAGAPPPVAVCPSTELLGAADWSAVIDARMRKRSVPERQRGLWPLTIGLGPNLLGTVDLAIETMRGERLGEIVAVSAMLVCYALDSRSHWFALLFAVSVLSGLLMAFFKGLGFGLVEAVWSAVALRRWLTVMSRKML
jgi:hypothetical protein